MTYFEACKDLTLLPSNNGKESWRYHKEMDLIRPCPSRPQGWWPNRPRRQKPDRPGRPILACLTTQSIFRSCLNLLNHTSGIGTSIQGGKRRKTRTKRKRKDVITEVMSNQEPKTILEKRRREKVLQDNLHERRQLINKLRKFGDYSEFASSKAQMCLHHRVPFAHN